MSVDQVTMNTHSRQLQPMVVALTDPQQRDRRQARHRTKPPDGPARPPPGLVSGAIRRTSRSRGRSDEAAKKSPPSNGCGERDRDHDHAGHDADEKLVHRPPKRRCRGGEPVERVGKDGLVEIGPQACRGTAARHTPPATAGNSTAALRPTCGSAGRDRASRGSEARPPAPARRSAVGSSSPAATLRCQLARCCRNLGARAIIQRDDQGQPVIVRGPLNRGFEAFDKIRRRTPNNRRSA